MDIKVNLHNRFDIEVIDTKTGEVRQKAQAENVITNTLWSRLMANTGSNFSYFKHIGWGSGTGTPAVTDTAFFHEEGWLEAQGEEYRVDWAQKWASCTRHIQLSEQTSVGVEISEVGIGCLGGSSNKELCTHAMLEDMNGNIITINKTNTDVINIYATVFIHWTSSVASPQFQNTNLRQYMFGVSGVTSWDNFVTPSKELYPIYHTNVGRSYFFNTTGKQKNITRNYDAQNKRIVLSMTRMAVGDFNVNGIGMLWVGYDSAGTISFAFPVSAFYLGDDITNEAVGTGDGSTTRFALDFDFPENAKIYVNGVQKTSGVTVRRTPLPRVDEDSTGYGTQMNLFVRFVRPESTTANMMYYPVEIISAYTSDMQNNHWCPMTAGRYIENVAYEVGFGSIQNTGAGKIYGSNDFTNWTLLADANSGTVTLTGNDQHYKYFKNTGSAEAKLMWNDTDGKAVIFDTAPAVGDVITADYHTPYVAKDADHVFDLTITIQFGAYSE